MLFGELVALLVIVIFPLTLPVTCGAKTAFNWALWPAAMVAPATPPVALNPAPLTLTCETVKLELPVFFTVTVCVVVPPTTSFPKFKLLDERESVRVALAPVPVKAIVSVGFVPLLFSVTPPVTLPEAVGEKATVMLFVCAAANVTGTVMPLSLNPVPLTAALEIVTLVPPVFFNCTVCEFVVPFATDPKLMLAGVAASVPAPTPVPLKL